MAGDPYFANRVLMLHGDGANGSTSIVDYHGHTVTRGGSPVISTAQSKAGGASIHCPANTDYVSVGPSTDFQITAAGSFTLEFWVWVPAVAVNGQVVGFVGSSATWAKGFTLLADSGTQKWRLFFNGLTASINGNVNVVPGWNHIVLAKNGDRYGCGINGALVYSPQMTFGTTFDGVTDWCVRLNNGPGVSNGFVGAYYDEVRFTQGIARYTGATYTIPPPPFADTVDNSEYEWRFPITNGIDPPRIRTVMFDVWTGFLPPERQFVPVDADYRIDAFSQPAVPHNLQYAVVAPTVAAVPLGVLYTVLPPFGEALLTAPMARLAASGHVSQAAGAALAAPMPTLAAGGGGGADLAAPMARFSAAATSEYGEVARAELRAPMPVLSAHAYSEVLGAAALTAPMARLSAFGGAAAALSAPMGVLFAFAQHGVVVRAGLKAPMPRLTARAVSEATGGARLRAPMGRLLWGRAKLAAPMARLRAEPALIPAAVQYAYCFNARLGEFTEFDHYPFRFVVRAFGHCYGVGAAGLYLLEGDDDAGTDIAAEALPHPNLFASTHMKRIAHVWMDGGEAIAVTPVVDGVEYPGGSTATIRGTRRADLPKGVEGRLWSFRLRNVAGGPFTVRTLEPQIAVSKRKV